MTSLAVFRRLPAVVDTNKWGEPDRLCVDQAVKTDHKYEWNSGPDNDGLKGCADCTREIRPPKHPSNLQNQSVQFCQSNDAGAEYF